MNLTKLLNQLSQGQTAVDKVTRTVVELGKSMATITTQISEILGSIERITAEIKEIREELQKVRSRRDKGTA